jgi:glycolate oxidase
MFGLLGKKPVDKLIELLGREKVSTSLLERKLYSYDATPIPIERALPSAVVFPTSQEDVQKLVKVCYEEEHSYISQGCGLWFDGWGSAYFGKRCGGLL